MRKRVLLTDQNLKTLAVRYDIDDPHFPERGEEETVMRPEDFEDDSLGNECGVKVANATTD